MAAIPGLGGGLMPQDTNVTGAAPGRRFRCSDEMKASAVLLTSLGRGTLTHYTGSHHEIYPSMRVCLHYLVSEHICNDAASTVLFV